MKTAPETWSAKILPGCTVHDGDTLTHVTLDIGWRVARRGESIRLTSSRGPINCPEVTGREAAAGKVVRDIVDAEVGLAFNAGTDVWLRSTSISRDVHGRTVGEIWLGKVELGTWLLDRGLAKLGGPGGKRVPFTDAELAKINLGVRVQ